MQPRFLLFPRPTNNDTYHLKRALKRLGRARSYWVYILSTITRSWLHNRESGYLSLSRLCQRAGSGKKAGCSSLCKRLADVYHRAGQNNYKLFNMSRRLVGLPNCKAKGPSGRVVFFSCVFLSLPRPPPSYRRPPPSFSLVSLFSSGRLIPGELRSSTESHREREKKKGPLTLVE